MVKDERALQIRVFTVGETVLDIVFENNNPQFAKAGGSVLNAAVCLSRLGLNTELISEIGKESVGHVISSFLNQNGVSTRYSYFFETGQTGIALAFLNDDKDAEYSFYRQYPRKRLSIKIPDFKSGDALIFGSSFALCLEVRKPLIKLLDQAREKKLIILYDPNYRKSKSVSLAEQQRMFKENISKADIIRGSHEDFISLLGKDNPQDTFKEIRKYSDAILIYTQNSLPGVLMDDGRSMTFYPHQVTVRSTIGAGDNFNAGIIAGLAKLHFTQADLHSIKDSSWNVILDMGSTFAAIVCASNENYISKKLAERLIAKA